MILNCNSCQKKFLVPDNAIPEKGRLVQCSACGNKWVQYPEKITTKTKKPEKLISKTKQPIEEKNQKITKNLKKAKNKKPKLSNPYTEEYLKKKHGISIKKIEKIEKKTIKKIKQKNAQGFGFYNYIITYTIMFVFLYGALNLTRELIDINFPYLSIYIDYFFETVDNFKLIIKNIISD